METKICSQCKQDKPVYISKTGKWKYSKCKECQEQYRKDRHISHRKEDYERDRLWKKNNPDKAKAIKQKAYRKNIDKNRQISRDRNWQSTQWYRDLKESTPCKDCGNKYPYYVSDYDHINGEKLKEVAALKNNKELALIEIAKCELICSNCHRIRTHKRKLGLL